MHAYARRMEFLSIQAQDFIEEPLLDLTVRPLRIFLSIQAQDFIEDVDLGAWYKAVAFIPEHSSSGLH